MSKRLAGFFVVLLGFPLTTLGQAGSGRWFEKDGSERKDILRLSLSTQNILETLSKNFSDYKNEISSSPNILSLNIQKTNERFRKFEVKLNELQSHNQGDRALGLASVLTSSQPKPPTEEVFALFFKVYVQLISIIEQKSFPNVPVQNIYDAPIKGFVGWILGSKDHARQVHALMKSEDPIDFKEDMPQQKLAIFRHLNFLKNEERYGFLSGLKLLEKRRLLIREILVFERNLVSGKLPDCPKLFGMMGTEAPSKTSPTVSEVLEWAKILEKQIQNDLKYFNTPDGNLKLEGLSTVCQSEFPEIGTTIQNLKRLLSSYNTLYRIEDQSAQQAERLGFDPIRFRLDPRLLSQKCQ